jgi:hypothetical protein
MGWWQIASPTGGIDWSQPSIRDVAKPEPMYGGDGPADSMGIAVDEIISQFEETFERKPYRAEIRATLDFVLGGYEEELEEGPGFEKVKKGSSSKFDLDTELGV